MSVNSTAVGSATVTVVGQGHAAIGLNFQHSFPLLPPSTVTCPWRDANMPGGKLNCGGLVRLMSIKSLPPPAVIVFAPIPAA